MITAAPTSLLNVPMPPSHQFLGPGQAQQQQQQPPPHLYSHHNPTSPQQPPQQHQHQQLHYLARMKGMNPGAADPALGDDPSSSHNDDGDDFGKGAKVVLNPGPHDVLLGRGGGTNNHAGNVKFRQLVGEHKELYFSTSKVEKPNVARHVVSLWRQLDPPGRFLMRKEEPKKGSSTAKGHDGKWFEVDDDKAREKASQCLRERTAEVMPYLRRIRQEQDALTERGVITFQESLMQHKQEEAQRLAAKGSQPSSEAVPVTPSSSSGAELDASTSGEVGHMPGKSSRGIPRGPYPPTLTPSFSRRTSCPTMAGPPPPGVPRRGSLPVSQGVHPMYPGSVEGGIPYEYPVYGGTDHHDYYYAHPQSEPNADYAYQTNMLEMQRQMEAQEMQIHEMQERMRIQHQHIRQQQQQQQQLMHRHGRMMPMPPPPLGLGGAAAYPPVATVSPNVTLPDEEEFDPLPIDDADDGLLIDIPINTSVPEATSVPLARSDSKSSKSKRSRHDALNKENSEHSSKSRSGANAASATPAAANASAAPDKDEDVRPDVATSSALQSRKKNAQDVTTALTDALQADAAITTEEYRRQLEAYMFSHNHGEPGSSAHDAYDKNGEVDSDLDDDDEGDEPKYEPRRHGPPRRRRSRRGVDRNVSGCSFMSTDTQLSTNLSIFSNMSMLSENLSASSCGARERRMNAARSMSSNLSLMSDVTDISHTLDDLRL